jgi:hypothetical protein
MKSKIIFWKGDNPYTEIGMYRSDRRVMFYLIRKDIDVND